MEETSVRRSQVIQQKARETLNEFLHICSEFIPREQRGHFRSDFSPKSRTAEDSRQLHQRLVREIAGGPDEAPESWEIIEEILRERLDYANAFIRMLQATADGKVPTKEDLIILTRALNLPCPEIRYWGTTKVAKQWGKRPYDTLHGPPDIRQAAEKLRSYLDMTDATGPVHAACQACGLLMIRKRGGRKYCSSDCSKKAWNYKARKEKLAANRKFHQRQAVREKDNLQTSRLSGRKSKAPRKVVK